MKTPMLQLHLECVLQISRMGVKKMQEYVGKKYRGETNLASWLKSRDMSAFTLGKTLDNTIYKTKIIRSLGGFPKLQVNAGVDTTLAYEISMLVSNGVLIIMFDLSIYAKG